MRPTITQDPLEPTFVGGCQRLARDAALAGRLEQQLLVVIRRAYALGKHAPYLAPAAAELPPYHHD